ncbi:MAG: copper resistance protein CopC [Gemmatimonadales bacterium]
MNMRGSAKLVAAGLVLIVATLALRTAVSASAPLVTLRHIVMDKSEPADGSTVGPVSEIRLYFSGAPLMRGASVRVVTSARQLMRSSPPAADTEDPKQVYVLMDPPLPPGTYVVQWRCIADDGHVMRGDFSFEVAPQ